MIIYGDSRRNLGLEEGSTGQLYSQLSSSNPWLSFQVISSFVEIAAGVVVGGLTVNPVLGAKVSAGLGLAFASARLTENVASGRDFSVLGTVVDFAIPAATYGATAFKVSSAAANASAETANAIRRAQSVLDNGDLLRSSVAAGGAASETVQSLKRTIGYFNDEFLIGVKLSDDQLNFLKVWGTDSGTLQQIGINSLETQNLITTRLSPLLDISNKAENYRDFVNSIITTVDAAKDINPGEVIKLFNDRTKLFFNSFDNFKSTSHFYEAVGAFGNYQLYDATEQIVSISKSLSIAGDVGSRTISNATAQKLLRDSGATADEIKLVGILLAAAKDQGEFNSILVGFISTLSKKTQGKFLDAFIDNVKLASTSFSRTGDILLDTQVALTSHVNNTLKAESLISNAAENYVKQASKPSILQKLLGAKKVETWKQGERTIGYSKNLSNYEVFKGREFYDKVARRVQWLKPQDAARDVTTPYYRGLKDIIKKSKTLKKLKLFTKKANKLKDIRDVFVAGGGTLIDSNWILGYKLVDTKTTTTNKIMIMIYFDPVSSRKKDPVFITTTNKELAEFMNASSPGQYYIDHWALARNGKKGSSAKINKILMTSAGLGSKIGLLPIQVIRTLTSVVSTFSRVGSSVIADGWGSFWDEYIGDFGQKIGTNIATRTGRILGTTVGTVTGKQILRRESQRFSNLLVGQGLKNVIRGEQFFNSAAFSNSLRSATLTGVSTANRAWAGSVQGRGFSSYNSGLQRISVKRYANLGGGLIRSPFQGGYRPSWMNIRF